jgi:hypothetical protein
MQGYDEDVQRLKDRVDCGMVLERLAPGWRLDARESTRRARKYRRGPGEVLIVSHEGRGWWDPTSERKGDIFTLARALDPGLDFGGARRLLRDIAGIAPTLPGLPRSGDQPPPVPPALRWERRPRLSHGSPAWLYLTRQRGLPAPLLLAARAADVIREGPYGSAWFAHRDVAGGVTGIEMRGPAWRGFSAGGGKTLFRFPGGPGPLPRLAVCEAAIDALSLAAIEHRRDDTLYAATAGGIGPGTVTALHALLRDRVADPAGILVVATDADGPGRRLAARLTALAAASGVRSEAILPPDGLNDWNDALRAREMLP